MSFRKPRMSFLRWAVRGLGIYARRFMKQKLIGRLYKA